MADDQLKAIVARMVQRGESEDAIAEVVRNYDAQTAPSPAASHERQAAEHPHARTWRKVKENGPLVGALLGSALTGGASIPLSMVGAASGAVLGSRVRGDSPEDARAEGLTAMAMEGGIPAVAGALRWGAKGFMKGAIPKNIAKEFDAVDLPAEMLDRGVFPGVSASRSRVSRLSAAANAERDAAAATVPVMPRRVVTDAIRPIHARNVAAHKPDLVAASRDYMRQSAREIGSGLTGPEALARKDILQDISGAARASSDSRAAVSIPGLADAERGAIVSHLRATPRMATALDESRALMAIDDVMKDAAHSNVVTRARIGGLPAAALSPLGLGATAHAVNVGAKAMKPQTLRALALMALLGDDQ